MNFSILPFSFVNFGVKLMKKKLLLKIKLIKC